ncbi:autotransporter assembly complex protein TamA [Ancylobacter defluvii]|uniref:Membrane protein n=1 Tax=Ancylobacter defluvii TaxID=1282440 RepID=A0A9W6K035_9HYPH|nr:autotransporter assembly complex family protein [Ancylobacter defluvii]MBS7588902.1 outer membrane protein assembly factor [Ancylobacter defluvii]GLK84503.1 membrane protein [Ancylobacter defluvii]
MLVAFVAPQALLAASPALAQSTQTPSSSPASGTAAQPATQPTNEAPQSGLLGPILDLFNPSRVAAREPPTIDATPYNLSFEVKSTDRDVRSAVEDASNLERLKARPPAGAAGLIRRALSDGPAINAALYSIGYYGSNIRITVAGNSPDAPNIFDIVETSRKRGPVPVVVTVDPGPLFHFGRIAILDANTRRPLPDAPSLASLGLQPGEPALATTVVRSETVLTNHWRDAGHPFARVVDKDVVADHAVRQLDVSFYVEPGPRATFGRFSVNGADFLTPRFIEDRIDIAPGTPYSPDVLNRLRRRLLEYESIASVRIIEADHLDPDGSLPITIEVSPRKPHYIGFSASYSSTDGSAINGYWGARNLFGGGETLRLDAQVSWFGQKSDAVPDADPFGYKVAATFMKPGIITARDDLLASAAVLREVTNAYVREAGTFLAGIRHRFNDEASLQISIDLEQSRVEDTTGINDYFIAGVPFEFNYDNTDNRLDPSKGIRFTGIAEPFAQLGDANGVPTLLNARFSTYYALDEAKKYILAGRVAAGSMLGADLYDIPPQRRFYVGGGGSLRGYDYQSASPRNEDGIIIGGRSYFEASFEARIRVTDSIGVVPFFDMGSAFASEAPDFDEMKYSAGIGLRYYTAIGPLRFDVAFPLNPGPDDGSYGIYVSLGQAF